MSESDRQKNLEGKRFNAKARQILHGALPEFLQHGYTRTSMERVAKSAGVSKQTLYSYYSDKKGLFTALIEEIAQRKFQLVWSPPLTGKPEKVLQELAERMLNSIQEEEYLNFMRLIISQSGQRADLAQLFLKTLSKPTTQSLTEYLEQETQLNLKDAAATARIFIGSIIYFTINQEVLHGKEIMPMESDRFVQNLISLVINGEKKTASNERAV